MLRISLTAAIVLAASLPAVASITGTTGMATQISPPASCFPTALITPIVLCWDEQQGRGTTALPVDMTVNPSTVLTGGVGATPGVLAGTFDSHFLHFDFQGAPAVVGTVSFSGPIVGVAYQDTFIDLSDTFGAFGTAYPTGFTTRGWNQLGSIAISGNTISFTLTPNAAGAIDPEQMRVFTAVPAPGTAALAGLGGLAMLRRRRR